MLEKNILLIFTERNNRSTGVPCFTWFLCKRKRSGQIPFNSLWTLHLHKLALKWTCVARYTSEKIRNLLSLYWPGWNFKFTTFGDLHLRPKKNCKCSRFTCLYSIELFPWNEDLVVGLDAGWLQVMNTAGRVDWEDASLNTKDDFLWRSQCPTVASSRLSSSFASFSALRSNFCQPATWITGHSR